MGDLDIRQLIRDLAVSQENSFSEAKQAQAANNADLMSMISERNAKVDKTFAEQAERIARLEIAINRLTTSTPPSESSLPTAASASDFRNVRRKRETPEEGQRNEQTDPTKLWLLGFPRRLMRAQIEAVIENYKTYVPENSITEVKTFGINKKACLTFASSALATMFFEKAKSQPITWTDSRAGSVHPLRVSKDTAVHVRNTGKILGHLWQMVMPKLQANEEFKKGYRLMTDRPRGTLFVASNDDIWELFECKAPRAEEGATVGSCEGCAFWNIPPSEAASMVESALAKANTLRG